MIAEHAYEYEMWQRVEVAEGDVWLPATITGRFIGPVSGMPVYIFATATGHRDATHGADLRPVSA